MTTNAARTIEKITIILPGIELGAGRMKAVCHLTLSGQPLDVIAEPFTAAKVITLIGPDLASVLDETRRLRVKASADCRKLRRVMIDTGLWDLSESANPDTHRIRIGLDEVDDRR